MHEATTSARPGKLDKRFCSTGKAPRGIGMGTSRKFLVFGSLIALSVFWAYADFGVRAEGLAPSAQGEAGPATADTVVVEQATVEKARTEETTAYYRDLVETYLTWTPPPDSFDFENPFRVKLLEADREMLGEIFREMYAEPFRAIPLRLIWLWGEMGANDV